MTRTAIREPLPVLPPRVDDARLIPSTRLAAAHGLGVTLGLASYGYDARLTAQDFLGPLRYFGVPLDDVHASLVQTRVRYEEAIRIQSVQSAVAYKLGLLCAIAEGEASAARDDVNATARRRIIAAAMAQAEQLAMYLERREILVEAALMHRIRRAAEEGHPVGVLYPMCVAAVNGNHAVFSAIRSPA